MYKLLVCFITAAFLIACSTSPTGRTQIKLLPASQLNVMGLQAFEQMKGEQDISSDNKTIRYVQCIADRITPFVPKSVYQGQWEVVVFESEQANAFALPGGRIGVYTGLLKYAQNQDQLAAVIGHEVGHVIAEHGNERMSGDLLIGLGMQVTDRYLETQKVGARPQIMAALGIGSKVGIQLPFSRTHESEADHIGLDLMAKAGFNPEASVTLWENMGKIPGEKPPEVLSTHPAPATRIAQLQNLMPPRLATYQRADKAECYL